MTERRAVALVSAALTYLLFIEYLPPLARVHLPADLGGYHAPLLAYALEAIQNGGLPLWDASMYCGIPFAGNIQAALFYPGTWLLFAAHIGQPVLGFKLLELFVFAHAWLAFNLCYSWLRDRPLGLFASLAGASVFGFGGYMLSQSSHAGVVTGYAWTPLAWIGIDQAVRSGSWRPLWKTAAASALCFLAGYPSTWAAFAIATCAYALGSAGLRAAAGAALSVAASLALVAVQLLPTVTASTQKVFDIKYGNGIRGAEFYLCLLIPNYFDFNRYWGGLDTQFIYLGVAGVFGVVWAARERSRAWLAGGTVLFACFVFLANPFNLVLPVLERTRLLIQVLKPVNFVEPATLAIALIAAAGIDAFLERTARPGPAWLDVVAIAGSGAWCARQIWMWLPGPPDFPVRWASAADLLIPLTVFCFGLYAMRRLSGRRRTAVAAAMLALLFVDVKAFGTSRKFNTEPGDFDDIYGGGGFRGMSDPVYEELRANRHYRIALDDAPSPTELRRFGLATPQGFDPMLTARYRDLIERHKRFSTNRLFEIAPDDDALLELLAVRYFITREGAAFIGRLDADPDWRLIGKPDSFFRVYEYARPRPPWRWEGGNVGITMTRWEPEHRELRVDAASAGRLILIEQRFPGWRVLVDGRPAAIEPWNEAFQSVALPAGSHTVSFRYLPLDLAAGGLISILALLALAAVVFFRPL